MLDFIGSIKMDQASMDAMKAAGIQLQRYHKPVWWKLTRLNNRTHRKLLVVDGKIGFTGGVGIADKWRGEAQDSNHWRDTHFRVEGPVVGQIQAVFTDNWTKATGAVLDGDAYFPALTAQGDAPGADVQQLAHRRQRKHAPDVPDGDHRRAPHASTCRTPISCRTS